MKQRNSGRWLGTQVSQRVVHETSRFRENTMGAELTLTIQIARVAFRALSREQAAVLKWESEVAA